MTPRKRRDRLNSLQQISAQLRETDDVSAPDLTSAILNRVDASRPFLDGRTRRMLWAGRASIALCVAMVGLGIALTHRLAPGVIEVTSRPAPLSNVVETVKNEAGNRLVEIRTAVALTAPTEGTASSGSGGLLTLVTAAAPAPKARNSACVFCGPVMPPADAARLAPSGRTSDGLADVSLANFKTSAVSMSLGSPWATARLRSTDADHLRVILDDLAPLGSGPAADSALAPK